MKIITLKVQIKIDEEKIKTRADDIIDDMLACIETPIQDDDGPMDHLQKHGYEVMIMDRSDK